MTAGIARPDLWTGIALNADPNDTNTPRVWTPLESSRLQLWSVGEQVRGRDYELAQAMSSSPSLLIRDINEDLNPANPSSPYAGDVECYREVCQLAQWPITPVGAAVNLINSGTWRGSGVDPYDPTFESYTTGASAPNWLERTLIAASPTITTTNPQQGTKCATFNVLAATGPGQGVRVATPVIPGRQYTSSAYVRQTVANTMGIFVEGITAVYDAPNRTVVSGLGTPNASWLGAAYSTSGGSASDYNVNGGQLKLTLASASTLRIGQLGSFYDSEQTVTVTAPALATGDSYVIGLVSRYVDASNYYRAFIEFRTDGSLGLIIERRLAAVNVFIADVDLPLAYAAGDKFTLHFSTYGGQLTAWCWPVAIAETQVFTTDVVLDSSAALQASGGIGIMAYRFGSNTNSSPVAAFENYGATGSVAGTSTTTTGAYVRLSVTYTADQVGRPAVLDSVLYNSNQGRGICMRVHTVGSVADGTVNIDAIQHEQAASASTFNASGPVIYPAFRLNMERYPRGWLHRGFEGVMNAPCVDALAQLNRIDIPSEYDMMALAMAPDLYYQLDGSGTNAAGPDTGGRGGPALVPTESGIGAGTAYSGGTTLDIPGAPGASGTAFTAGALATPTTFQQGTIMAAGYATPNPLPLAFPLVSGGAWAITIAAWVKLDASQLATSPAIVSITRYQSDTIQYRPIQMTSSGVTMRNGTASGSQAFDSSPLDGQTHFLMVQIVQDATNTVFRTRIDGIESETTSSTATFGFFPAGRADTISVGGIWYTLGAKIIQGISGTIGKVGVWQRELTFSERDSLWQTGSQGSVVAVGEPALGRVLRHVQAGAYRGPTRIANTSSAIASASLGAPTYTGTIDLLTDSLNNVQADLGVLWVQPDGVIAAEGKLDRWLRLTPDLVLGENVAGGEYAYAEQPLLSHDPRYVFPVVTWKRSAGATASGGLPADVQAAIRKFFPRKFDASSDFWADYQAQDAADWVFYSHRNTLLRTETVTLDPWSYTGPASLWPVVLTLEPGRRVTLVRRAKAANGGAGLVISRDFFVEKVVQPATSYRAGEESWTFELQLSPAGAVAAPGGAVSQPWILGDTTWSVLDSTTVLGW